LERSGGGSRALLDAGAARRLPNADPDEPGPGGICFLDSAAVGGDVPDMVNDALNPTPFGGDRRIRERNPACVQPPGRDAGGTGAQTPAGSAVPDSYCDHVAADGAPTSSQTAA